MIMNVRVGLHSEHTVINQIMANITLKFPNSENKINKKKFHAKILMLFDFF